MTDPYDSGLCRWWHHSGPTPELLTSIDDHWLQPPGTVVDLGCGLGTELAELTARGWHTVGLDISAPALRKARKLCPAVTFIRADVRTLPFTDASIDAALDRGCYHYLSPADRSRYVRELARVLQPGGRLLLRACLYSAGTRNDITETGIRTAFRTWRIDELRTADLPSDTRAMPALLARLVRP